MFKLWRFWQKLWRFFKKLCGAFFGAFWQNSGASEFQTVEHTVRNLVTIIDWQRFLDNPKDPKVKIMFPTPKGPRFWVCWLLSSLSCILASMLASSIHHLENIVWKKNQDKNLAISRARWPAIQRTKCRNFKIVVKLKIPWISLPEVQAFTTFWKRYFSLWMISGAFWFVRM